MSISPFSSNSKPFQRHRAGDGLGTPEGIGAIPQSPSVHADSCSEMLLGFLREPLGEQGLGSLSKPGCHLPHRELVRSLSEILEKSLFV